MEFKKWRDVVGAVRNSLDQRGLRVMHCLDVASIYNQWNTRIGQLLIDKRRRGQISMQCGQMRKEKDENLGMITRFSAFDRISRLPRLKAL